MGQRWRCRRAAAKCGRKRDEQGAEAEEEKKLGRESEWEERGAGAIVILSHYHLD